MKIMISQKALQWFKEDMEAQPGESIRFFARYGGSSSLHEGFSLGLTKEEPTEAAVQLTKDDIHFYIEDRDVWYFDGHDLSVSINSTTGEIEYTYE
ncbi:MAG: HesB/YadR/YfhF family protein [Paenisporosarcina sp.]